MRKEFEEQQKRSPLAGMAAGGTGGGGLQGFDLAGLLAGRSSGVNHATAEVERERERERERGTGRDEGSSGQGGQGRIRRRG